MKTLKERVEIEAAGLDGDIIEFRHDHDTRNNWDLVVDAHSDSMVYAWREYDYRIKLEPMEFYISIFESGTILVYETLSEAPTGIKTIKVREVIE